MNKIDDLLSIQDVEALHQALRDFDQELRDEMKPLEDLLAINVLSPDNVSLALHCAEVERWRGRLSKILAFASGFVEYSKSSQFNIPKQQGVTEFDREGFKRRNSAGFTILQKWVEELMQSVDSRVNLCKKFMENKIAA